MSRMVPFLELKPAYLELKEEFDAAYQRVMDSGWYLLGSELEAFESEYASYCGTTHCVALGSGLDAITLSLIACGVKPGDEVLVPSHTFIATWMAVSHAGATPVPIEPDANTYNMDPNRIKQAITAKTKAIVPVHLYGQIADMSPIMEIAERFGLKVIEDAAQSQGARYRNCRSGSLGRVAAHSFYPGKNLGAFGDAGAVTTDDGEVANRIRRLRNYGSDRKYYHETLGVNSRLDELQCAFLRVRLRHLDNWNKRRRDLAASYLRLLAPMGDIVLPQVLKDSEPVWHLFVIRHESRDHLQTALARRGITTLIHYPIPCGESGAFRHLGLPDSPVASSLSSTVLSLPISPFHTAEQIEVVCSAVKEILDDL